MLESLLQTIQSRQKAFWNRRETDPLKKRTAYLLFPLISLAAGGLTGLLIRNSVQQVYPTLIKPWLTPPAWVFPVVWTVLFALMGIGMAMVVLEGHRESGPAVFLWALQLILNVSWSLLFFNGGKYLTALACLAVLWLVILAMIREFSQFSRTAARMQVPYLVWTAFAGYLNLGIWMLNA